MLDFALASNEAAGLMTELEIEPGPWKPHIGLKTKILRAPRILAKWSKIFSISFKTGLLLKYTLVLFTILHLSACVIRVAHDVQTNGGLPRPGFMCFGVQSVSSDVNTRCLPMPFGARRPKSDNFPERRRQHLPQTNIPLDNRGPGPAPGQGA